jgi:glucan biosynthesis protein
MITRKLVLGGVLGLGLFASGVLVGQDVSARRHPNLNAAQRFMEQAVNKLDAAQQANEFDMNGHAAKAKDLLGKAYAEVKMAAEAANHH